MTSAPWTPHSFASFLSIAALLLACSLASGLATGEVIETVRCDTTAGPFVAEVHPSWSPNGAKRFLGLVKDGFFDNSPLFRVIPGFLVQFGISLDYNKNEKWKENILDDPHPFNVDMKKGIMAFAGYGKDSRNTQVWVGYEGCARLGKDPWETPFAEVISGYENTECFYSGYGGSPSQGRMKSREGKNLTASDSIDIKAEIVTVRCDTTAGPFVAEVHRSWSPHGAARFLYLVEDGFFDNSPLFRVIPGFLVQFGISLNYTKNEEWERNIFDDPHPANVTMKKGIMAFAGYGKDSRNTQVWVGYEGCTNLGKSPWETPFAQVISGYENTKKFYSGYGDRPSQGRMKDRDGKNLTASDSIDIKAENVAVQCDTTVGPFVAEVHRSWSPHGAARFLYLVEDGFFDNSPLFRVIPGFLVQFGISLNYTKNEKWGRNIWDDPHPANVTMKKGIMAFAGSGKDSRNTQVWVGYAGCTHLGKSPWETPFAQVISGYENTEDFYSGYGGKVSQGSLKGRHAVKYVEDNFPYLSMINRCYLVPNQKLTAVRSSVGQI
eukprot:gene26248-17348_t